MAITRDLLNVLGTVIWGDLCGLTLYRNAKKQLIAFATTKNGPATSPQQERNRVVFQHVTVRWNQLTDLQQEQYVKVTHDEHFPFCGIALYTLLALYNPPSTGFALGAGFLGWAYQKMLLAAQTHPLQPLPDLPQKVKRGWILPNAKSDIYAGPDLVFVEPGNIIYFRVLPVSHILPMGHPVPLIIELDGLGYIEYPAAYNGHWFFIKFYAPRKDAYSSIRIHWVRPDGVISRYRFAIDTLHNPIDD